MLKTFKKYCKLKNMSNKYGHVKVDGKGKLFVETVNGEIITHLGYNESDPNYYIKHLGKLVKISKATCGYETKCQVGKPYHKCVENGSYSPNKCAIIFIDSFNLSEFKYELTFDELKEIKNESLHERIDAGLNRELKRQKAAGKEFISNEEIDNLIDRILKEEMEEKL